MNFNGAVRAAGTASSPTSVYSGCVIPCRRVSDYIHTLNMLEQLLIPVLVLPVIYRYQHAQDRPCQTSTGHCVSFSVFHVPGWFIRLCVFALRFLMSESLPYSLPLGSSNRPSVGGQRLSSRRNPRSGAVIWLPVIPAVPWVCCHHRRCSPSRCWQTARWTHSGRLWRFPMWNQNTGPGAAPNAEPNAKGSARGAARQRWKTAIYHSRRGSRSASRDRPGWKHSSAPVVCYE